LRPATTSTSEPSRSPSTSSSDPQMIEDLNRGACRGR
jgi:hypothetical protein